MQPQTDEFREMVVLLVDDDPIIRRSMEVQLQAIGVQILKAENGARALEILGSTPVDLVLMDGFMPILDGFATCAQIKEDPLLKHIPIIMLTSMRGEAKSRAFAAGADDFLNKPPHFQELLSRLANHLRLVSLRQRSATRAPSWLKEHSGRARVLVIMGEADDRNALATYLRKQNLDVRTAAHLKSAATFLNVESPELLILEERLPDGDGLAFCRKLRHFRITQELPILLILGADKLEGSSRELGLGILDLLVKPFGLEELELRTRNLLRQGTLASTCSPHGYAAGREVLIDPRTGLPGRPFFESHLQFLCGLCQTNHLPLCIAWFRFPEEPRWGEGGKRAEAALNRLKQPLHPGDTLCRVDRDLFIYLFPGATVAKVQERLQGYPEGLESGFLAIDGQPFEAVLHTLAEALSNQQT
ncbi:MAG TPA: response regulator [Geothrix sp.]|nr:response regulator [Geothrix sp.]